MFKLFCIYCEYNRMSIFSTFREIEEQVNSWYILFNSRKHAELLNHKYRRVYSTMFRIDFIFNVIAYQYKIHTFNWLNSLHVTFTIPRYRLECWSTGPKTVHGLVLLVNTRFSDRSCIWWDWITLGLYKKLLNMCAMV